MVADMLFPADFFEDEEMYSEEEEEHYTDELEEDAVGYRYSIFFDFEKGDFVSLPDGKLKMASGIEAWEQWCEKIVQTQRFSHEAYSTDIGVDFEKVLCASNNAEAKNVLNREITEALMADPSGRTLYVENPSFETLPDGYFVKVIVDGVEGNIEVAANLTESGVV